MTTRSTRPLPVIELELDLTRTAMAACRRVCDAALAERRALLADGWPDTHALCQDLDATAERWGGQAEQQRQALMRLMAERDTPS